MIRLTTSRLLRVLTSRLLAILSKACGSENVPPFGQLVAHLSALVSKQSIANFSEKVSRQSMRRSAVFAVAALTFVGAICLLHSTGELVALQRSSFRPDQAAFLVPRFRVFAGQSLWSLDSGIEMHERG